MPNPALLCDIGNVIVRFDFNIAARRIEKLSPYPAQELFSRLDHLKLPYEDGQIDDASFVQQAMRALEFGDTEQTFTCIWQEIFSPNEPMIRSLETLRSKVPLYLLSNTSGIHHRHLFATYDVFSWFRGGVYSYLARSSKPDPAIFRSAIDQLELQPDQTLFVDDLPTNIATAQELGFVTHCYDFNDHEAFEAVLNHWLASHGMA